MARRAVVTGANRGIGLAIATALLAEGLEVVVAARRLEDAERTADEIGGAPLALDLLDPAGAAAALVAAGSVDVLINNAGILENVGLFDPGDNFARSMRVMLEGPYELMRAVLPGMGVRGYGRIVNVSSGWGSFARGLGGGGAYGIAKAALNALTVRAAAGAPRGVLINAMSPGWVATRMGGAGAPRRPEQAAETALWLARLPSDGPTGRFFGPDGEMPW